MTNRITIVVLTAITLATGLAACNGGGGAGEPCCLASGSTEQPLPSFAAPGEYMAEPIVFEEGCLNANLGTFALELPPYRPVGSTATVQAGTNGLGRYEVTI